MRVLYYSSCTATKGDCTVRIKDSDFMDLVSGKLSPQKVVANSCY